VPATSSITGASCTVRIELELAGLYLRQVEHLVDEAEQVRAGAVHALQRLHRLLRAEARRVGDHHLGETDDGVERRAQLVTHAGYELRLVCAGLLELAVLVLDLVEQARVLDCDDGVRGEILQQLDLLVGERAYLQPVDDDHADQLVLPEHRNRQKGPCAYELGEGDAKRILRGSLIRHNVFDVNGLLGAHDAAEPSMRTGTKHRILPPILGPFGRRVVHGHDAQCVCLAQVQVPDLRLAKAGRVRKDRLEHRRELAGRARYDAQHLVRRRLPLQGFAQLALRLRKPAFEIGS